jgi:hypothetical protein
MNFLYSLEVIIGLIGIITGIVVTGPSVFLGLLPFIPVPLKISISVLLHIVLFGAVLFLFIFAIKVQFAFGLYLVFFETMTLIYGITIGLYTYASVYFWKNRVRKGNEHFFLSALGISSGIILFGWPLLVVPLLIVLSDYNTGIDDYLSFILYFFGIMVYGAIAGLLTYSGAHVWNKGIWQGSGWYFMLALRIGISGGISLLGWLLLTFGLVVLRLLAAMAHCVLTKISLKLTLCIIRHSCTF